jgi:hypothetical protein
MGKVETSWMPLEEIVDCFYRDNPRSHSLDGDIKRTANRLLSVGWLEHVTFNETNRKIVDGHGRVLAAQWLSEQSSDWFSLQFATWKRRNPDGDTSSEERFNPAYWQQVAIIKVNLDEPGHIAMLLGLNNEKSFGVDDPTKLEAIAASLDDEDKALAGFAVKVRQVVQEAIATGSLEESPSGDYEGKQYFERPDATDYSVGKDTSASNAIAESGEVVSDNFEYDEDAEPDYEEYEPEEIHVPQKTALNISLPFPDWKKFNAWKKEKGIAKDSDAFWKGLQEVFEELG